MFLLLYYPAFSSPRTPSSNGPKRRQLRRLRKGSYPSSLRAFPLGRFLTPTLPLPHEYLAQPSKAPSRIFTNLPSPRGPAWQDLSGLLEFASKRDTESQVDSDCEISFPARSLSVFWLPVTCQPDFCVGRSLAGSGTPRKPPKKGFTRVPPANCSSDRLLNRKLVPVESLRRLSTLTQGDLLIPDFARLLNERARDAKRSFWSRITKRKNQLLSASEPHQGQEEKGDAPMAESSTKSPRIP